MTLLSRHSLLFGLHSMKLPDITVCGTGIDKQKRLKLKHLFLFDMTMKQTENRVHLFIGKFRFQCMSFAGYGHFNSQCCYENPRIRLCFFMPELVSPFGLRDSLCLSDCFILVCLFKNHPRNSETRFSPRCQFTKCFNFDLSIDK